VLSYVEPKWGSKQLAELRHTEIQSWVSGMTSSASIVIRNYGILASVLDGAVEDRRLSVNPARGVNLPRKVKKPHVYLTHEQVWALANASGSIEP
jgi:site-specific recombinase XerC